MEEHDNLAEKIKELLGGAPGKLKVLEQQIDMDLQLEYYECSQKMRKELGEEEALEKADNLAKPGYSPQVKREILARLASMEKVECFRRIEAFLKNGEEELRDWTRLALNESRMLLESSLLDENQVFISTGLGGRDQKLRYFVVLVSKQDLDLNETQKKVIGNEFETILSCYNAEVEEIRFSEFMAAILILLPMQFAMSPVFREAILECNYYGDFLENDFIVTNVKKLSFPEIKVFLEKKRNKSG